jgi:hypothetical protein
MSRRSILLLALAAILAVSAILAAIGLVGTPAATPRPYDPNLPLLAQASPTSTLAPQGTPIPGDVPGDVPSATPEPTQTPSPTPTPIPRAGTYATRIVAASISVDLPIVKPKTNEKFPLCDVAEFMHLSDLYQPGQGGVTYVYAHARPGMFGIFLHKLLIGQTKSLIGVTIKVYTNDDMVFTYRISKVLLHQHDLSSAYNWPTAGGEVLMLQTCETDKVGGPLMIVQATLVSSGSASHAAAHPTPHPRACA